MRGIPDQDPVSNMMRSMIVISQNWQSDLVFFNLELRFLRSLIDKYFIWLVEDANINRTREASAALLKLEKERLALEGKVSIHLKHLADLMTNPFTYDSQKIREDHGELEDLVMGFVKEFRKTKKEIFSLTEVVIETEKVKHLITR